MATQAAGTFTLKSWDEQPYEELEGGGKLTRAHVEQTFAGDIEGDGDVQWLMCYRADETADFIGLQRVAGSVGGRAGTFVLRTYGTFDGKEARGAWEVLEGSGSGELRGLRGTGAFSAPPGSEASVTLDYEIG